MSQVEFILDEAAVLGPMDSIDSAVGIGRGYGLRLHFYYQSLGQLRKCFPNGQDQALLSNVSQIFFAVNDNATAEYVSTRLGEQTVIVESGGKNWGNSWQSSHGQQPSHGSSDSFSDNQNWNQQARRLLKPEEVIALPSDVAITFTAGVPPVATRLIRYYQEKRLLSPRRSWGIVGLIYRLIGLGAALLLACPLKLALQEKRDPYQVTLPSRQRVYRQQGVNHVADRQGTVRRSEGRRAGRQPDVGE